MRIDETFQVRMDETFQVIIDETFQEKDRYEKYFSKNEK